MAKVSPIREDGKLAKARLSQLAKTINEWKNTRWTPREGLDMFLAWLQEIRSGNPSPAVLEMEADALIRFTRAEFDPDSGEWRPHIGTHWTDGGAWALSDRIVDSTAKRLLAEWRTNPYRNLLEGPCQCRRNNQTCGKYYVRRTNEQKYCSAKCGRDHKAYSQAEETRNAKLNRARVAISEWADSDTRQDWKSYVVANANKGVRKQLPIQGKGESRPNNEYITVGFLTHSVNEGNKGKKGELKEPKKRGR